MIHVIASIKVRPERLKEYLQILHANVPKVMAETGFIQYQPTIDIPANLPPQQLEADVVTLIEKWSSLETLRAHLASPHMADYRVKVKDMVLNVSIKVLQDV